MLSSGDLPAYFVDLSDTAASTFITSNSLGDDAAHDSPESNINSDKPQEEATN